MHSLNSVFNSSMTKLFFEFDFQHEQTDTTE